MKAVGGYTVSNSLFERQDIWHPEGGRYKQSARNVSMSSDIPLQYLWWANASGKYPKDEMKYIHIRIQSESQIFVFTLISNQTGE